MPSAEAKVGRGGLVTVSKPRVQLNRLFLVERIYSLTSPSPAKPKRRSPNGSA